MCGIADENTRVAVVVWRAADIHKREITVFEELLLQALGRDEARCDAREVLMEELDDLSGGFQRFENAFRGKEVAGKCSFL